VPTIYYTAVNVHYIRMGLVSFCAPNVTATESFFTTSTYFVPIPEVFEMLPLNYISNTGNLKSLYKQKPQTKW
jgi:hypothetical protein